MCRLYNTYIFVFGSLEVTKGYYILRRKGKVSKMSARKSQNNNICIYHLREAAKKVIFLIFKAPPTFELNACRNVNRYFNKQKVRRGLRGMVKQALTDLWVQSANYSSFSGLLTFWWSKLTRKKFWQKMIFLLKNKKRCQKFEDNKNLTFYAKVKK